MDDRRVIGGVYVIRHGLQWKDAPPYGLHKTLYNRFIRRSRWGAFDRVFAMLSGQAPKPQRVNCSHTLQGASHGSGSVQKGYVLRHIGRTKGGLNS